MPQRITRRTAKGGSDYDILEDDGRENAMRFTIQFGKNKLHEFKKDSIQIII